MVPDHGMTVVSDGFRDNVNPYTSGMWNTLRTLWVRNMETLVRIHESCKRQSHLECADIFTPTRHILQAIRRTWKTDRVHGLLVVTSPTFFPSASKNNDTWWDSQDTKTVYLWDSMDNHDRQNTLSIKRNDGVSRSRDGVRKETFSPRRPGSPSNVG